MSADLPNPETQEAPKGPDTLGDPVLIMADEALQRASEQEAAAWTRREKGLQVTLIDGALDGVKKKIEAEDKEDPKDFNKLSKLTEKKAKLEAARAKIMAVPDAKSDEKIAKVDATLKAHAEDLKGNLKEIEKVKARMGEVQKEIDTYKSATSTEDQLKYSAALAEMGELTKQLTVLEKDASHEEQKARLEATAAARKKAEAMAKADHGKDEEEAEKGLREFEEESENPGGKPENSAEETAGADKDKSKPAEDDETKYALKKELLNNALHNAAYGMAVVLEKDYPGEDGNAYEKMMWNGKALLLKVLIMFGGTPKWAELIKDNAKQREFLEKKVGIQFVEEDVKKDNVATGEKRWAAKFVKPVEGWEPGVVEMADVFETVYGKNGGPKMMEKITDDITLQELEATVPETDGSEEAAKTRRLVKAMKDAGASGESKVQEFLTKNAGEVQENLEPKVTNVASTSGKETKEALEPLEELGVEVLAMVQKNKLHEQSKFSESIPDGSMWTAESIPILAERQVSEIKTPEDLVRFSEIMTHAQEDFALFGIQKDPRIPTDLQAKASDELSKGKLSDETSEALKKIATAWAEGVHEAMNKTMKEYAEVMKRASKDPKEQAQFDAVLAALKDNNPKEATPPTVESAPATESIDKEKNPLLLNVTSFELHTDDASAKALADNGIAFKGRSMVKRSDTSILRDFGDAKTVEFKSLGNDMFTLTITTPPSTINGLPSGVKTESTTFQGMDSLMKPQAAPQS